ARDAVEVDAVGVQQGVAVVAAALRGAAVLVALDVRDGQAREAGRRARGPRVGGERDAQGAAGLDDSEVDHAMSLPPRVGPLRRGPATRVRDAGGPPEVNPRSYWPDR